MCADPDLPEGFELRRIRPGDGKALAQFYRGLSAESRKKLTPLGLRIDRTTCEFICFDNFLAGADKYDLILLRDGQVVGWCFLWGVHGPRPAVGLAVAEAFQRQGLGRRMLAVLLEWARRQQLPGLYLTVERDNDAARRLYESFGFTAEAESGPASHYCEMSLRLDAPGTPRSDLSSRNQA